MSIRSFVDGLSEEQAVAARLTAEPVLTLAGAGSGKTRMLMGRFAHLVSPVSEGGLGADPGSIMMVTFTNKAAREMRERIKPLLEELRSATGQMFGGDPWIGTFHGLSLRILRIEADKAGLGKNFSIFDESDAKSLVNDVVEEMGIEQFDVDEFFRDLETAKARMLDPAYLKSLQSKIAAHDVLVDASENFVPPSESVRRCMGIMRHFTSANFVDIYAAYQNALQEQNAVDFNDLMNRTTRLMQQSEEVRNSWRSSFRHFMVDEVQDINRAQVSWLMAMTDGGKPMDIPDGTKTSDYSNAEDGDHVVNTYRLRQFPRPTVAFVGDDDQSIYAFRGSDLSVMRGLEQRFPGMQKCFLKTSYRCQPAILAVSNLLVSHNQGRFGKDLVSHAGAKRTGPVGVRIQDGTDMELKHLCKEAEAFVSEGGNPSEFAILTRTRDIAKQVAKSLRTLGLPVVEGKSADLRKTAEVKDIMGFVTFLVNPDAEVPLRRIINKPSRGLGPTSLRKVTHNARIKNSTFLAELNTVLRNRVDLTDHCEPYKPAFVKSARDFGQMISDLRVSTAAAENASEALLDVLRTTGYLADLYRTALKSSGLQSHEAATKDMNPEEFLRWLLKENAKGNEGMIKKDLRLDGEDLVDRAGQISEASRRIGNIGLLLSETEIFDSLEDFAQESVLEMSQGPAPAGIQVMTIHGSKGLEFDHVRLPFWIEGVMPHGRAVDGGPEEIEEERRLAYVAMTRARMTVEISRPRSVNGCTFIRQKGAEKSRFITDIEKAGYGNILFKKATANGFAYEDAPVTKLSESHKIERANSSIVIAEPTRREMENTKTDDISYDERFAEESFGSPEDYGIDMMDPGSDADMFDGWDPDMGDVLPLDAYEDGKRAEQDEPAPF